MDDSSSRVDSALEERAREDGLTWPLDLGRKLFAMVRRSGRETMCEKQLRGDSAINMKGCSKKYESADVLYAIRSSPIACLPLSCSSISSARPRKPRLWAIVAGPGY